MPPKKVIWFLLPILMIGISPIFASQAISMSPLDVSVTQGQPAQFTITVYDSAAGGSADILIYSPLNSPYKSDDISRVSVQSPKGNVALSFSPDDSTLLIGKVDTFSEDGSQMDIPITITIASGAPIGEYDVSARSVLPNGGVNGFVNAVLRITGAAPPPENPTPPPAPSGTPLIKGITMTSDYDKAKKYKIGDKISFIALAAKNIGDAAGSRTIDLIVTHSKDGKSKTEVLYSYTFTLDAGHSDGTPNFVSYVFKEYGTYEFKWDDLSQLVTVYPEPDDPRDQPVTSVGGPNIYGKGVGLNDISTEFKVGQELTITSVIAENVGDATGTKTIPFKMTVISEGKSQKETLFSETFTLKAGESQAHVVNHKLVLDKAGQYLLEWGPQTHIFKVTKSDDPRDQPIQGTPDIRGYQLAYWEPDFFDPRLSVNDEIYFLLLAQNFGDGTGSKTLDLKATYLESKNPTKTIHTEKFTLKPGQKTTAITSYIPKEPGRYMFEWDDVSQMLVVLDADAKDDPRDAPLEGKADIRGAGIGWNAYDDPSGLSYNGEEFRFNLAAVNYGDAVGSRDIPFTVTITTDDGKSITKILEMKYIALWPGDRFNDIVIYRPDGPGFYIFDWDGYTASFGIEKENADDPRDAPQEGNANIRGAGLGWNVYDDTSGVSYNGEEFHFDLAAENYGDAHGSRSIPFTVTITANDGKSVTETLRINRVVLDPGERSIDTVVFHPDRPGKYVFDWDGYTTSFEIGKEDTGDPHDASLEGQPDIRGQSVNVLDNADPKNRYFTPWDDLRIEVGALNHGDVIGTRDIDVFVERYYGGELKEKYRIDTIQFTLKPEEYSSKNIPFVPQEIGEYRIIWDRLVHTIYVRSEKNLSDDPRDAATEGKPNIKGLAMRYTSEHGTIVPFYINEDIYFHVLAQNFGDVTGTKKLDLKITYIDEDRPPETLYTKTYTLKPGEQQSSDKTISYTPREIGNYYVEWDDYYDILPVKNKPDDPRDASIEGKPDIRGWVNAGLSSGMFDVNTRTINYGDTSGTKTLKLKMTSYFDDGKSKTETLFTETYSLKPGEYKDINFMDVPKKLGLYIFEFDESMDAVRVANDAEHDIRGLNIAVKETKTSAKSGSFTIGLNTINLGEKQGTRTLDLKVTRISQGQSHTESIYQETFTLGPSEQDYDSIQYEAKEPGLYVFEWDNEIETITIGDIQDALNSSLSKSIDGGGCLIATATYGTELAPQVQLLRETRDNVLFGTSSGAAFMMGFNQFYYSFSPTISDWERQNPAFKEIVKITITPMLSTLSILNYVDVDSEQEMLGYGIGIILLNLGMYLVAPAIIILKIRSKFSPRPYAQK